MIGIGTQMENVTESEKELLKSYFVKASHLLIVYYADEFN